MSWIHTWIKSNEKRNMDFYLRRTEPNVSFPEYRQRTKINVMYIYLHLTKNFYRWPMAATKFYIIKVIISIF